MNMTNAEKLFSEGKIAELCNYALLIEGELEAVKDKLADARMDAAYTLDGYSTATRTFAREIEEQKNLANAALTDLQDCQAENAALRLQVECYKAEVKRWMKWGNEQPWLAEIDGYKAQLWKLTDDNAALRADKERLDWLEKNSHTILVGNREPLDSGDWNWWTLRHQTSSCFVGENKGGPSLVPDNTPLRIAIDAARAALASKQEGNT
jgi:hypothetical protein